MDANDLKQFSDDERQELLEAETKMYSEYFEGSLEDRKPIELGILAALLLHVFLLYITFPSFKMAAPSINPDKIVYVQAWRPPPPPQKEPPKPIQERKLKTKKIPIPDPTPDDTVPTSDHQAESHPNCAQPSR